MTPLLRGNIGPAPSFGRISGQRRPSELFQLAGRWNGHVPDGGIMAEEKKDGWRAGWFPGLDGQPRLWTRNGMPIEGTDHIAHWLRILEAIAGEPMFVDGEFQVGGTLAATKAWCESGWKQGGHAGTLYVFDAMPLSDWQAGRCDTPWVKRKTRLTDLVAQLPGHPLSWEWAPRSRGAFDGPPSVEILDDIWLFTADDVREEASRVWAREGEGLMLKDPEAPYERGRVSWWQKVKRPGAA